MITYNFKLRAVSELTTRYLTSRLPHAYHALQAGDPRDVRTETARLKVHVASLSVRGRGELCTQNLRFNSNDRQNAHCKSNHSKKKIRMISMKTNNKLCLSQKAKAVGACKM